MNLEAIRNDFPILKTQCAGRDVVYFDNAATTQKPLPVLQAAFEYSTHSNGNPHRGAHIFAIAASEAYDGSKETVRRFLAEHPGDHLYPEHHGKPQSGGPLLWGDPSEAGR